MRCPTCKGSGLDQAVITKHIAVMRRDSRLSLRLVAKQAKISPTHLCDLENGRRDWTLATLADVINAIQVLSH